MWPQIVSSGYKRHAARQRREDPMVAGCLGERPMHPVALHAGVRGKVVRTAVSNPKAPCPLVSVSRQFRAHRPNQPGS
ncbi:MAG: hypothetical protein Q8L92_07740, partial [Rubrivivax sp.]|nr:hypothetical protein [Rubrivivax sp.]